MAGPLTPGQVETGHAPGDATASQWVRVAQGGAGANWGAVFMPRIGTEVLVEFIEGDIDRPLVVGQLYNGQDALPWPAGVDSGTNHPGTLSGWHSHTLDGEGLNQWVIDDASAQSTQMDAQEALAQLKGAQQLGQALGNAAGAQGAKALASHAANDKEALQGLIQSIDPALDGKHPTERKTDGRDAGDPAETFAKPYVLVDTPSAAIVASPATLASFSGQDTSLAAQGDVHASAAHTASLVSGQTTSLYTHQGELQTIAANGNLSLRAHTDALEILADRDITVISVNDEITITASQRIEMVGGDSKVVLDGANINFITSGAFTVKAATHSWAGGGSGSANLPALPIGSMNIPLDQVIVQHIYHDQELMAGTPFEARLPGGAVKTGTLDGAGQAVIAGVPGGTTLDIRFGQMPGAYKPKDQTPMPNHKASPSQSEIDALLDKYRGDQA